MDSHEGRKFWSSAPLAGVEPPRMPPLASPIDAFIQAKLEEKGLNPAPPGDKRTLLRRATFDLICLSGWSPHDSQPKPLIPVSATASP